MQPEERRQTDRDTLVGTVEIEKKGGDVAGALRIG